MYYFSYRIFFPKLRTKQEEQIPVHIFTLALKDKFYLHERNMYIACRADGTIFCKIFIPFIFIFHDISILNPFLVNLYLVRGYGYQFSILLYFISMLFHATWQLF